MKNKNYQDELLLLSEKIKDYAKTNNLTTDEVLDLIRERLGG